MRKNILSKMSSGDDACISRYESIKSEAKNSVFGYIYVRNHWSYDAQNGYKLGKANNIPERNNQYVTGEIIKGYFVSIYEVPIKQVVIIERLLQYEFRELHIKDYDGGIEFYNRQIINLIEPYLITLGIKYKKLTDEEISRLNRLHRIRKTVSKINMRDLIQALRATPVYTPRPDQVAIINKSVAHLSTNDKGMLVLVCGMGKTLISLWITQLLGISTILIGVPNKLLLAQWNVVVRAIFRDAPCLIVSGGINVENIEHFLAKYKERCVVLTTYASAHKVYAATSNTFKFGMKLNDETHHLTTNNINTDDTAKTYIRMLNIPSNKQLSLTATLKNIESPSPLLDSSKREESISNNDVEHFGEIIERKCVLWAINEGIICDYVIQTIVSDVDEDIAEDADKRLFLSAFATLKSIFDGHSHHLLVYSNNKYSSLKIFEYIKKLIDDKYFDIPDLYYSNYHSEMKAREQRNIIECYEKAKYGIIICIYCLSEGFDHPPLNGVVFAENMTSNIRIVQAALRASRKNKKEPNKITTIILPILDKNDWLDSSENPDLKKVKEVIYQMSLEDETIEQKIKVSNLKIEKQLVLPILVSEGTEQKETGIIGKYNDELTQALRLRTTKRTSLVTPYEKARKIIADKNIKSKEAYYALCDRDIRLPREPEVTYKGRFSNWIEYLSIERVYYDLETCKKKVKEYLLIHPEFKKYYLDLATACEELCKIDASFPPSGLWVEYYNVHNLRSIIAINIQKKKKGPNI